MKKNSEQIKSFRRFDWIWIAIVSVGVLLRLRQYFVNRSLWVDEASLALNIVNRSFSSLLLPLDYDQGAPIGFLYIEKALVLVFGNHDYILRLFPLFSGILATYLMYLIANEILGKFGVVPVLLFSFSGAMIHYSSEVKQYASDVMIALLLTYLTIHCIKKESQLKNIILLGIVGVLSIWISHPSAFLLPLIGFLLVIEKLLQKTYSQFKWLLGIGITWVVTFLTTYVFFLRHLIGNENLQNYWDNNYAPMPVWEYGEWYRNAFVSILPNVASSFLPNIFPNFEQATLINACLILILLGAISLLLRNKRYAFLIVSPILIALLASALNRYPIYDRFIYFWFPALLFLIAEGLKRIYFFCSKINLNVARTIYGLCALVILWSPFNLAFNNALNPPRGEDIKPVLTYLQENTQAEDVLYVHHSSITPFLYYAPFYNFETDNIFVAKKSWNFKRFTIDVINFQGHDRVWFILSHVVYCDCDGESRADRVQAHIQLLDEYGVQLDYFEAERAAAYLYDLSP